MASLHAVACMICLFCGLIMGVVVEISLLFGLFMRNIIVSLGGCAILSGLLVSSYDSEAGHSKRHVGVVMGHDPSGYFAVQLSP